jgi:hypothetical protein
VLGVEFDTISLEARLPPNKIQKVIRQISAIMDKGTITRREAEELAGHLQWYSGAVRLGRALHPVSLCLYLPGAQAFHPTTTSEPGSTRPDLVASAPSFLKSISHRQRPKA